MILRKLFACCSLLHLLPFLQLTLAEKSHGCTRGIPKPVEWDAKAHNMRIFRVNDRNVRVVTPKNYHNETASPLILAFHDKDQAPEVLEFDGAFSDPEVNPDAIVVYPQAVHVRAHTSLKANELTRSESVEIGHLSTSQRATKEASQCHRRPRFRSLSLEGLREPSLRRHEQGICDRTRDWRRNGPFTSLR